MKRLIRKKIIIGKKAFSLIELSVVIVILSIIITGLLSIAVNSAANDKIKRSKENMDLIYKALGAYLLKNGALPCPAAITSVKSTNENYGKAGTAGTCADQNGVYIDSTVSAVAYGMVPIADLGLSSSVAEDGFGNKFGYFVDKNFTNKSYVGYTGNTVNYTGFDVLNNSRYLANSIDPAIFAIVSYGANKYGTFNANSASQNTNTSPSLKENSNYPVNFVDVADPQPNTATFTLTINRVALYISETSETSAVMDDIILYKTRNNLIRDFQAFSLIKCPIKSVETGTDVTYNSVPMYWVIGGEYGQIVLSDTNCPLGWLNTVQKPGRRCGAFGQWEVGGANPSSTGIAIPCTQ